MIFKNIRKNQVSSCRENLHCAACQGRRCVLGTELRIVGAASVLAAQQSFSGGKTQNKQEAKLHMTQRCKKYASIGVIEAKVKSLRPLRPRLKQTNAFMSFSVSLCPKNATSTSLDIYLFLICQNMVLKESNLDCL